MGIITSIRKRGGLLITLIGLAVAGFVIMDVVQNRNMSNSVTNVGQVDGKTLDFNEMRTMEEILYQGSDADEFSKREYIWNYFLENTIITESSEKVGLKVGKQELLDMEFGVNLSPIMLQRYGNPQTGQIDMAQLQNVKDQIQKGTLPANMVSFWSIQEKEIIKGRLEEKLTNLFAKAIYTPTWQAELIIQDQTKPINSLYVKVPATYIGDTEVKLTDADFQKYIDNHKSVYTNSIENRIISTVNFAVTVSKADSMAANQQITDKLESFKAATNDSSYITANNGTISDVYMKTAQLDEPLKKVVSGLSVGDTYGPYYIGTTVKAAKLLGKSAVADSVEARHILISAKTPQEFEAANKKIDSVQLAIKSGQAKFADVAKALSTDSGSAARGGNLGYSPQGKMVKPFNDAMFINSSIGQLKKVQTQFGVHLIEITGKKTLGDANGYKLAYISTELLPSEATQNIFLASVEKFMAGISSVEQLNAKLQKNPGLSLQKSFAVNAAGFALQSVPSGQGSRDIIKWAFDPKTKVGQIASTPFAIQEVGKYHVSQYVIPVLTAIIPEGVGTVASLKSELTQMVMVEKKVEMLAEKAKASTTLEAMAQQFSSKVDTLKSVIFVTGYAQGIGNEPNVVANIFSLPMNSVSKVIKGRNGIFMVKPYETLTPPNVPSVVDAKRFYSSTMKQQLNGRLVEALKNNAEIEDNRSSIY